MFHRLAVCGAALALIVAVSLAVASAGQTPERGSFAPSG